MTSIQTLIGKRFETILNELYPELRYIGQVSSYVPDFDHPLFYAEAKVTFCKHDYASHLKQHQIDSFGNLPKVKPVLYIFGQHNFDRSNERLGPLSSKKRKELLSREMKIIRIYIVDNGVVTKIWKKRVYTNKKGNISDCTIREGHLRQIIENRNIVVHGERYMARNYYDISPESYVFSMPKFVEKKGIEVGHVVLTGMNDILSYFYDTGA